MRRALLKEMPALTKFYGLPPAAWDDMTLREVSEYVTVYRQAVAAGWRMVVVYE